MAVSRRIVRSGSAAASRSVIWPLVSAHKKKKVASQGDVLAFSAMKPLLVVNPWRCRCDELRLLRRAGYEVPELAMQAAALLESGRGAACG